ncbi:MAG: beta-galactosidase [Candidatus Taylorbacteria bacterium]|nr:beta-galactosidase [Candidatus Taylorbacteria bacterium]
MIKKLALFLIIVLLLAFLFLSFSFKKPENFTYGVSFSRFHTDELKLDWKETYLAILNDLEVRNFRFSAHWPLTEPEEGKYNFEELDFQMKEAQKAGASVILAVGRRLPGWPECHEPEWVQVESGKLKVESEQNEYKQERILKYIETVVNRYKNYENIRYWQVENEPYLAFFSRSACGELDEEFLKKEIDLVKKLDPSKPVLITDSGEFGTWFQAYMKGEVFGTSQYLYIWWREPIGPFRYPIMPGFFRIKHNLVKLFLGKKPAIVIELSMEPWLRKPILDTSIEVQLERMGIDKFNEMIDFSRKTGFDTFYLWGAEWWYWMKLNDHPEFWNRAKELLSEN